MPKTVARSIEVLDQETQAAGAYEVLLFTNIPTADGAVAPVEVTGTGYSAVALSPANMNAATHSTGTQLAQSDNSALIEFVSTGGSWSNACTGAAFRRVADGVIVRFGMFPASRTIDGTGDSIRFEPSGVANGALVAVEG